MVIVPIWITMKLPKPFHIPYELETQLFLTCDHHRPQTNTLLITLDFNSPSNRGIQYQLCHTRGNSQQISWWINFLIWQKVKWTYFLSSSSLAVSISIPSWSHCRVITSEPIKRVATSGRQIHSLISRCSATSCRSTSPSCPHHSKRRPHTTGERKNVHIVFGH